MKRLCLPFVLALCLLLSGCGSGVKKQYEQFSSALVQRDSLSFTARLRAEYEDKTAEFTLKYARDESGQTVTVAEPEIIAGISARIAGDGTALEYDGMILDTGELDAYGLTPMSALPVLVSAMESGHLESFRKEDGLLVLELVPEEHLAVTVWFDEEMRPLKAELVSEGQLRVACAIENWKKDSERKNERLAKEKLGGDPPTQYPP